MRGRINPLGKKQFRSEPRLILEGMRRKRGKKRLITRNKQNQEEPRWERKGRKQSLKGNQHIEKAGSARLEQGVGNSASRGG